MTADADGMGDDDGGDMVVMVTVMMPMVMLTMIMVLTLMEGCYNLCLTWALSSTHFKCYSAFSQEKHV